MEMLRFESPVKFDADANIDVGLIWDEAIHRYEATTMVKIESLAGARNVDEILNAIHERERNFKGYRHNGSKLDKFRTLISKCLNPIDKVGNMVASGASTVKRQPLSCSSIFNDLCLYRDSPSLLALPFSWLSVI